MDAQARKAAVLDRCARPASATQLLAPGDRIMVAMSGGKDSYTLFHLLTRLVPRLPFKVELIAVHLDQVQPGYDGTGLRAYLEATGLAVRDPARGHLLGRHRRTSTRRATYCSLCSRLRRGILYTAAERLGCNKLALGHHRDDSLETFLLNLFYSGKLQAMPASYRTDDGRFEVIRPLIECAENDIAEFAADRRLPDHPVQPVRLAGRPQARRDDRAARRSSSSDEPARPRGHGSTRSATCGRRTCSIATSRARGPSAPTTSARRRCPSRARSTRAPSPCSRAASCASSTDLLAEARRERGDLVLRVLVRARRVARGSASSRCSPTACTLRMPSRSCSPTRTCSRSDRSCPAGRGPSRSCRRSGRARTTATAHRETQPMSFFTFAAVVIARRVRVVRADVVLVRRRTRSSRTVRHAGRVVTTRDRRACEPRLHAIDDRLDLGRAVRSVRTKRRHGRRADADPLRVVLRRVGRRARERLALEREIHLALAVRARRRAASVRARRRFDHRRRHRRSPINPRAARIDLRASLLASSSSAPQPASTPQRRAAFMGTNRSDLSRTFDDWENAPALGGTTPADRARPG